LSGEHKANFIRYISCAHTKPRHLGKLAFTVDFIF